MIWKTETMMAVTWLHVSDFHLKGAASYDQEVILHALVASVRKFCEQGRIPDLIFATGDIAHGGKASEYELATQFFDDLLAAAGKDRRHLFIIPGNHDVDRDLGIGLARTLDSPENSDAYFGPAVPKIHLTQKQGAFLQWYNRYFDGIRTLPQHSTCGPIEVIDIRGYAIGILPLNSAFFCQDDSDHNKLWIGRRCLDAALKELGALGAQLNVALLHHPLDWLSDFERSNIEAGLEAHVDVVLRGHLHETSIKNVVSAAGGVIAMAAGAAYQTRKWPNRALYATFEGQHLTVFPIRYEDSPQEVWTVDPSLFPWEPNHEKRFPIPRFAAAGADQPDAPPAKPSASVAPPRYRSNIPSRHDLPFVGRDDLLKEILGSLSDLSRERVLVLHGPPGVGKSELAREFARRQRDRYPGGTFVIDASSGPLLDLVQVGKNVLNLDFSPGLSLQDQCEQTLLTFGEAPVLLIYDNVRSPDSIQPWLPRAGMPCHVLITTVSEHWAPGSLLLSVTPLSSELAFALIEQLAGQEVAARHGQALAALAGGLPVQICSVAATLAYEARRGRLDAVRLTISRETEKSFSLVYEYLESPLRLLLHAAAFLNCTRILQTELAQHLQEACEWSADEFQHALDACLDLHLLEGEKTLRLHQLLAAFLLATPVAAENADHLLRIRQVQQQRFVQLARDLVAQPANTDLAATLLVYSVKPQAWDDVSYEVSTEDGEVIGRALTEIGQFAEAQPWYERAVAAKEQGDIHGRVDHASLDRSQQALVECVRRL